MIEDYSYEYWKMLLEDVDNASSGNNRIIYTLVDAFGKDVVFSNKQFVSNDTINYQMFDILNKHLFENSLKKIKILYMTASEIVTYMKIEDATKNIEGDVDYSAYQKSIGIYDCTMDYDHSLPEPMCYNTLHFIEDGLIFLNKDKLCITTFMFTVASLCHEMIHYYDKISDDEYANVQKCKFFADYQKARYGKTNISFDMQNDHKTKVFKMKKIEAHQLNVDVIDNGQEQRDQTIIDNMHNLELSTLFENEKDFDASIILNTPYRQRFKDGSFRIVSY